MLHLVEISIMLIDSIYSIANKYVKYLFAFSIFLFFHNTSNAQKYYFNSNTKITHSLGFSMNNNYYLPESIYDEIGELKRKRSIRYGYEFNINYNLILPKNIGIKTKIYLFGTIPDGFNFHYKDAIPEDYEWGNGFKGNPLAFHKSNFSASTTGIPYFGFDILTNYSFQVHKNIIIQPEIGIRLMSMPRYSVFDGIKGQVCDSTVNNCIPFHIEGADNFENKRNFFPDLVTSLNFLIFNKNPKHNLKLGISFNYGFVPRMEGEYELLNMGNLNSKGKMKYNSTYLGFNVGYQFIGLPKQDKNEKSKSIFNPRY